MGYTVLTGEALEAALSELPGWVHEGGFLRRTFVFADFVAAFGWMAQVALVAERMNHHPEWFNVYHTVKVALQTHDVNPPAVTDTDVALARAMHVLAARGGAE
jgi:4a-hydroxytetrahydrobiopterin dehydratase